MLGVYNYTVILTYLGMISSFTGMIFTFNGEYDELYMFKPSAVMTLLETISFALARAAASAA